MVFIVLTWLLMLRFIAGQKCRQRSIRGQIRELGGGRGSDLHLLFAFLLEVDQLLRLFPDGFLRKRITVSNSFFKEKKLSSLPEFCRCRNISCHQEPCARTIRTSASLGSPTAELGILQALAVLQDPRGRQPTVEAYRTAVVPRDLLGNRGEDRREVA